MLPHYLCSLEYKRCSFESLKWLLDLSSHCGVIYRIFSLIGLYDSLFSLFDTENALLFSKIGQYFEFSCELWYDASTCAYSTASLTIQ